MSYINGDQWAATARASRPKAQFLWIASFCGKCGKIVIPQNLNAFYFDTNDPKNPRVHGLVCPNCNSHNVIFDGYLKGKAVSLN